jgi:hypothetical protein
MERERKEHEKDVKKNAFGGNTAVATPSIDTWTTVYGDLSGWGNFPNAEVEWIERAKKRKNKSNVEKNIEDAEDAEDRSTLVVAATLEGDISVWDVATNNLCWYETVGSNHGNIFALESIDVTGDGIDELISCAWDGTTYIFDRKCDCAVHDFDENVLAFTACHLTVSSATTSVSSHSSSGMGQYKGTQPCLVYVTNDAVTVFVMGSSTQDFNAMKEGDKTSMESNSAAPIEPTPSLELLGSSSLLSKTAVIHDPGRPICYVRPPSLEEALRHRATNLPERALALVLRSAHNANENRGNQRVELQTFFQSCLFDQVDSIDVLKAYRDDLKRRLVEKGTKNG